MLRSELFKRLSAEAEENTPDVYEKIMSAAENQGLFYGLGRGNYGEYNMNNYNGKGSSAAIRGGGKAMVGISSAVVALACVTVAGFAVWGGIKPSAPPVYLSDAYAVGVVSAAKLLDESVPKSESVSLLSENAEGGTRSGANVEVFDRYFNAFDLFGGKTVTVENGGNGIKDYGGKTAVKTENYYGTAFEYVMYYTEAEKEGGSGAERTLTGEINVDGTDYFMRGERCVKDGADEWTTVRVFAGAFDSGTYVQVDGGAAANGTGKAGEAEYRYTLVIAGKTAESCTLKTGGGATFTLHVDGENGGSYRVLRLAGSGQIKVGYSAGGENGEFEVKLKDGGYEYVFDTVTDPNGINSIEIKHTYGGGKYLWNEKDILAGKYDLYGAKLEITYNDGTVSDKPLTKELLGNGVDVSVGKHDITVSYGGKTAVLSVFVAPENGYIEAVTGNYQLNGSVDTLIFDLSRPDDLDFGGLKIKGEFNLKLDGDMFNGYYGETAVNERFISNFDSSAAGMQKCMLTTGNISAVPVVISEFNAFGYDSAETVTEERVFVAGIYIIDTVHTDGYGGFPIVYETEISPERPYLDLNDIADRHEFNYSDYKAEFVFRRGNFTVYKGNGDQVVSVDDIRDFDYRAEGYEVSGDADLWAVMRTGERIIKLSGSRNDIEVPYTVYDSAYTNIRFCRVHGEDILSYELKDGVTVESVKKDLLKYSLYVEYFEKTDGKYVDFVPVTTDMLDFDRVDETSYDHQYGSINYKDKSIAVNITKPYTVAGARVLYTLGNTHGVNFILSETTVNDLGQCMNDSCKEIVLYDNGVAVLKHTANGIGDVLIGYKLEGNKLTLLRHGIATAFLIVNLSGNTFEEIDVDGATAGMPSKTYSFSHIYFPEATTPIGWSGTFTAYSGDTGYDYCFYVNVHLSGWASTPNGGGDIYQVAGVEYVATWAYGWHNNKNAFVLRFSDMDWWFEIGTTNDAGHYKLTLIKKVNAS